MTNISNNKLKTNNILFENNDTLFKKYLMKSAVFARLIRENFGQPSSLQDSFL